MPGHDPVVPSGGQSLSRTNTRSKDRHGRPLNKLHVIPLSNVSCSFCSLGNPSHDVLIRTGAQPSQETDMTVLCYIQTHWTAYIHHALSNSFKSCFKGPQNLLAKLCYKTVMSVHQSELIMTARELSASVARPLSI